VSNAPGSSVRMTDKMLEGDDGAKSHRGPRHTLREQTAKKVESSRPDEQENVLPLATSTTATFAPRLENAPSSPLECHGLENTQRQMIPSRCRGQGKVYNSEISKEQQSHVYSLHVPSNSRNFFQFESMIIPLI
jgi:hypothetical protein